MKKVPPSKVTGEQIAALLAGEGMGEDEPVSLLVHLAVKRIVEEALKGAVRDILGREYDARRAERQGWRNGYRRGKLATGEGEVTYAIPQVRDADAAAIAELRKRLSGRTGGLGEAGHQDVRARMLDAGHRIDLRRRAGAQRAVAHRGQ